ncbi:hypothetical protein FRB99_003364, partial [Tulasnella sp. 403]
MSKSPDDLHRTLPKASAAIIYSTPLDMGTASKSEHLDGITVASVADSFLHDLKNQHSVTPFKSLLGFLLRHACCDMSVNASALLQDTLNSVLPLCKDVDILKTLKTYAQTDQSPERNLYSPFTSFANTCLYKLKTQFESKLLWDEPDNRILFHVNGPEEYVTDHHGVVSRWKPDLVVVHHQAMLAARDGCYINSEWKDTALSTALERPKVSFLWDQTELAVEINPLLTPPLEPLPAEYWTSEPLGEIPPEAVPITTFEPVVL